MIVTVRYTVRYFFTILNDCYLLLIIVYFVMQYRQGFTGKLPLRKENNRKTESSTSQTTTNALQFKIVGHFCFYSEEIIWKHPILKIDEIQFVDLQIVVFFRRKFCATVILLSK